MRRRPAEARRLADQGNAQAKALFTSGYHDAQGRFAARLLDTPWCNGAVWSMNSMPGIAGETTDFKNKWNPAIREELYGPHRQGDLDGEYIDSSEGYVTDELDFRRDHFAAARTPLTFSSEEHRPAIFRGLIAFEYVRGIEADIHAQGKLMMANGAPDRLCWLAPLLDVLGTETDWHPGGTWQPMSDAELLYRRAMCKGKPFCFLMNTRFEDFSARAGREVHEALPGLRHVPGLLQPQRLPRALLHAARTVRPRPAAVQALRAAVQAGGRGGLGTDHAGPRRTTSMSTSSVSASATGRSSTTAASGSTATITWADAPAAARPRVALRPSHRHGAIARRRSRWRAKTWR